MRNVALIILALCLVLLLAACDNGYHAGNIRETQDSYSTTLPTTIENTAGITDADMRRDIENTGWCEYVFSSVQRGNEQTGEMSITTLEVDKRMTDKSNDEIWAIINMQDEIFAKRLYLKLTYLNYTQGGWRLESIETYKPTEYLKIGEPQFEEMSLFMDTYFSGYSLESVSGEDTNFTCTFSIDEIHTNCHYTGSVKLNMALEIMSTPEAPEFCYWSFSLDRTGIKLDWSQGEGKEWRGLSSFNGEFHYEEFQLLVLDSSDGTAYVMGQFQKGLYEVATWSAPVKGYYEARVGCSLSGEDYYIESFDEDPFIEFSIESAPSELYWRDDVRDYNIRNTGMESKISKFLEPNPTMTFTITIYPDSIKIQYKIKTTYTTGDNENIIWMKPIGIA